MTYRSSNDSTDISGSVMEYEQYKLAELLSEEIAMPYNIGILLKEWQNSYTEHKKLMVLDCEVSVDYERCAFDYVKTALFNFGCKPDYAVHTVYALGVP